MGFWGKAIGAGMGFMVGGPIGAILGGVLGHGFDQTSGFDRYYQEQDGTWPEVDREFDRQYLFYVSLASLAAKMAKADGVVSREEIHAFDHFLKIDLGLDANERREIAVIFNEAKNAPEEAAAIAQQFTALIGHQRDVLHMMVQLLFKIAMADGHLHPNEERFIVQIAHIFTLSQNEFEQIKALFIKNNSNAYQILGVSAKASDEDVKKAYRKLVRENHPDRLMAQGVPEDFMEQANKKMAEINLAYDTICKERGI